MSYDFIHSSWGNYLLMFLVILTLTLVSGTLWPFSSYIPFEWGIPFLIYWVLYRETLETICLFYVVTFTVASTSSLLVSHLLILHTGVFLILTTLKNLYYTNRMFFGMACGFTLFLKPVLLWLLSRSFDIRADFVALIPWIAGTLINWILIWPVFYILKGVDHLKNSELPPPPVPGHRP